MGVLLDENLNHSGLIGICACAAAWRVILFA
jgi:hypothetical protein